MAGSGQYSDLPKAACLLRTEVHHSGTQFTMDYCTHCACENSTMHCEKKSCPVLLCKPEHQKLLPGLCCAQCTEIDEDDENQYGISHDSKGQNELEDNNDTKPKTDEDNEISCTSADKIYKVSKNNIIS